jgi:hypothetical protein
MAVVVLGVVAWRWPRGVGSPAGKRARVATEGPESETASATGSSTDKTGTGPASEPTTYALERAKRDQMRALIWQALGQSSPPDAAAPKKGGTYVLPDRPPWPDWPPHGDGDAAPALPRIDPKYIQESVRNDFFPLARKCYGDALEQNPQLGGKVVFAFNIVGDAKVGGIIEAVDVLNESTLRDPDVIDCMRQSFLTVTFPPPANGGEVTVVYPIVFSNDDAG